MGIGLWWGNWCDSRDTNNLEGGGVAGSIHKETVLMCTQLIRSYLLHLIPWLQRPHSLQYFQQWEFVQGFFTEYLIVFVILLRDSVSLFVHIFIWFSCLCCIFWVYCHLSYIVLDMFLLGFVNLSW
jgi:hypothetical protein